MERRFWYGIGILFVFLVLGLWVAAAMGQVYEPVAQTLEQAAQAALEGDPERGMALASWAQTQWERHWQGAAALADHAPMEEIDSLFAQLTPFGEAGDRSGFAACCGRLSQLVKAIGDAHKLTWWNVL